MSADLKRFARAIPKAELHVHLEGTITPEAYARIAQRNGIEIGDPQAAFQCDDFGSFLRCFLRVVKALRTPLDFAELATEYLRRSAEENVRHVELMLSPATQRVFVPDLDLEVMVDAVWRACEEARRATGVTCLLIFDMVRNLGEAVAFEDIDLALRCRERGIGVVGVGLGGDERNFPARDFERAFTLAAEHGFRRTVHAGEAAAEESIVDAVRLLGAERIGHGVSAGGKHDVLALLAGKDVAIDACITSNYMTRVVDALDRHPFRSFAGVDVTLNSDDPSFFRTTVAREYELAVELGCSGSDIAKIARTSIARSFLPPDERWRLLRVVDDYVSSYPGLDELGITR